MFKESKIVFFKPVAFKSAAYWRTVEFKVMYTSVLQALWEYLVRGGVLLNPDIYLAFPVFTNPLFTIILREVMELPIGI